MINDFVIAKQVKLLNLQQLCCHPCLKMIFKEFGLKIFIGSLSSSLLLSLTQTSTTERSKMILNDLYRKFYLRSPFHHREGRAESFKARLGNPRKCFYYFR